MNTASPSSPNHLIPRTALGIALLVAALSGGVPVRWAEAGLNRWTSSGPEGGVIRAIGVVPSTSGVVYAATADARVFKSATFGSFWTPLGVVSPDVSVSVIVADPTNGAILYAGTGDSGVFKSTNSGRTWSPSSVGLADLTILALAIDPKTPTTLYAGTNISALFKSTDAGASWIPRNIGLAGITVESIAINPVAPATLFASVRGAGVFRSDNGASTWFPRNAGLQVTNVSALSIDPKTPTIVYAGTTSGVFKTSNGGDGWGSSSSGLPGGLVPAVVVDAQTPTTLYSATGNTLFRSTNGGGSWAPRASGLPSPFSSVSAILAIDPKATATLYTSTAGTAFSALSSGVFRSTDGGGSWNRANAGIARASGQALAVNPQAPATLYNSTLNGVFKSTNGGASWNPSNTGLTNPVSVLAIDPQTPQTLYAGANAGVFKTTSGGASWGVTGLGGGGQPGTATTALAVDPQNPSTLYAGTCVTGILPSVCQLHKSTNGGTGFTNIGAGIPNLGESLGNFVTALAVDPQTSATVYAATAEGLFKSTNGGSGWNPSNAGLTDVAGELVIDPASPSILYAGTAGDGVFRSTNGGASWGPRNSGLTNLAIRALAIDPSSPAVLYAGTDGSGVFRSTNGGANWAPNNLGLGSPFVSALALSPSGRCLHASTDAGVFDFATQFTTDCFSPPSLVSSVLPVSRSVLVGVGATAFATIINAGAVADRRPATTARAEGDVTAVTCGISQVTGTPTPFAFQATDPATNQPIGTPNAPVDVAPGANATFVFSLTPTASFCPQDVTFGFSCTNAEAAPTIVGLNTLQLTASDTPVPDMIALAATPSGDGYVNLPGASGTNFFAMATTNVGVTGNITVSTDTGGATIPVSVNLCQTNPATGECLQPPAPTVSLSINAGATPTFTAFVAGTGTIADDPATNRIFVRFNDATPTTCGGVTQAVTRGSTSVSVRTQ